MADSNAWKHVEEAIHRMGGWYADQRVVDDLRPVIERYAATLGYSPPMESVAYAPSSQPVTVTRDDITDELMAELVEEILAAYRGEADRMVQALERAENARDDAQATSANKDRRIKALEEARNTWMDKAQDLEASALSPLKEEEAMLETTDPGTVLDQAIAAAERAETAATRAERSSEAASKGAEIVLRALQSAEPGAYRITSDGGVWTRVGVLDKDVAESFPARLVKGLDEAQAAGSERIRSAAKESAAPLGTQFVPAGMKRCSTCETMKPLEKFRKDSTKPDGYRARCKTCQTGVPEAPVKPVASTVTAEQPVVRTVSSGMLTLVVKTCNECAVTKPVEMFSKDAKSAGGVKAKCKDCCAKRDAENARRKREAKQQ